MERNDIINWRRKYLKSIRKFRSEGRPIYYLDETWLNEGHTKGKIWVDTEIIDKRQAFVQGLSTGLKNPTGKGRRLIILHIGSEDGFVNNCLLVFEGKKSSDYHEEMNANIFEKWFSDMLHKLPDNAVIVMDNASYHSRRSEKIPTQSSKKKEMQEWLASKNIEYSENMVRSELLTLIKSNKEKYVQYVTDELARKANKTVLRLPPYHCELNPIELIWAQIKNEVASNNVTFKLSNAKILLQNAIQNVTADKWKNCIKHVIAEEEKMFKLDGLVDDLQEPFIIQLGNDSDTDSNFSTNSNLD